MFDQIKEECGVFGIYSKDTMDVASQTYFALYALQHRGQESCGIVVNDKGILSYHKDLGLVPDVFNEGNLRKLGMGNIAIGHVRYSTTGKSNRSNAQPLVVRHIKGPMAIAHNGNLVNARDLREKYELNGGIFHNTNDTEVISYAITEQRLIQPSIEKAVEQAMYKFKGAYSLVIMSPKKLIAARDPQGFRPLCMGETETGAIVFASESCALDSIGARFIRDVEPGEIIIVDKNGAHSLKTHCGQKTSMCVFEYVYIARPDSVIEGSSVHQARLNAGKKLWQESPVEADVVVGVPDSGLDAALGFSMASGIPYGVGFIKNRYVGRTFIQPSQSQRSNSVRIKLNVIKDVVKGKRVVLIDDSIVRGTTSARIVNLIREAGATEVHMRISSPPFTNPCYFGIDIDSKENLIACQMSIEEIAKEIGADSLGYLSIEGVKNIAENAKCNFCTGCFTGEYPIRVPKEMPKDKFERKIDE
ncbi:amidophosphoribosyltransferase [Porcipelethomonas ammoniilytica]|jgi:amidophosphoribosyltransferase|uniref:amidophosphoribosyltransferase n=1 Tax=Porcipelethomonas TaxID=2981643 RepID=UPI000821BF4F|nr:amidophosphoribosyltransferase [Porcipelethomonas ammoniilytica]MBS6315330.1 amidophosphoribosyltransferase [Ruminococcus sp.]MEE0185403.1 amidophosphoribosyltransferase [Oscillospiraceae bacterium]OLA68441.1 MAG: amidophosphoribosyltransferase [Ruminococcus sp. 37_24]SCI53485.1 Amidophosphoribosyltransferase precursor [uncultured Ruminococcus sp.]MCU6718568.1 amidophosphoribosyltransferase [Porcipelethomonas ammoniilytica]